MSRPKRDYSAEDMTWAVALANRGYTVERIARVLATKPSGKRSEPYSIKYQRILDGRGLDAADRYVRRTAEKAVDFVKTNPAVRDKPAALVHLFEIESATRSLPWFVYGGPGARRALEAACQLAQGLGSITLGLALRHWAELSGQNDRAVRSNRDLLVKLGWLRRRPGPARSTGRYTLRVPSHIQPSHTFPHTGDECAGSWVSHDAFRPDALGDGGWYVLHSISAPTALHVLEARLGYGPDGTELLEVLEEAGLVTITEGIVARASDELILPQLKALAVAAGTNGSAESARARHMIEREEFNSRGEMNVQPFGRSSVHA